MTSFRCAVCGWTQDKWGRCGGCGRSGTLEAHRVGQQSLGSYGGAE